MTEWTLFGEPISQLFLYFVWYSFLGWCMETCWTSIRRRRFVNRGFLKGPLCPIYGFGILLMVLFLSRFTRNVAVFYVVAVVTMSAWEYLVGWLLEVTTHMRYWDYSKHRYQLHGRICLECSLLWGLGAYVAIYWIHPSTQQLFGLLDPPVRQVLALVVLAVLLVDVAVTVRGLAMITIIMEKARLAQEELERRRAELAEARRQKRDEARLQSALLKLELEQRDLLADAAHYSRRFLLHYDQMGRGRYAKLMERIRREQTQLRDYRAKKLADLKEKLKREKR